MQRFCTGGKKKGRARGEGGTEEVCEGVVGVRVRVKGVCVFHFFFFFEGSFRKQRERVSVCVCVCVCMHPVIQTLFMGLPIEFFRTLKTSLEKHSQKIKKIFIVGVQR